MLTIQQRIVALIIGRSLLTMDQNATHAGPDFIGSLPPPAGVIPDFIDSPTNQAGPIIVGVLGLFSTTVCVWVRVWTKVRITRKVEWEDCK